MKIKGVINISKLKKYIILGGFGFVGASSRMFLKNMVYNAYEIIPFETLIINIIGSFLLSLFLNLKFDVNEDMKLGISTGFFGAFTTFSTICKELNNLIFMNQYDIAFLYAFISLFLGIMLSFLGYKLAYVASNRLKAGEKHELFFGWYRGNDGKHH